ncbi:MAG: hypothetical protein C5B51_13685 [Terriglobia bacterium]|nr:MAG: hypothetical protein C5B51_13685 [Terriglobia bacterium]
MVRSIPSSNGLCSQLQDLVEELRSTIRRAAFSRTHAEHILKRVEDLEACLNEYKNLENLTIDDQLNYYDGISISAEIYDYHGKFKEAFRVVQAEGAKVDAELDTLPRADEDRTITNVRIRLFLAYCQTFYRSHRYLEARGKAERCKDLVDQLLKRSDDPDATVMDHDDSVEGTAARTYYFLGQVYRQLSEYERSRVAYVQATELLHDDLKRKYDRFKAKEDGLSGAIGSATTEQQKTIFKNRLRAQRDHFIEERDYISRNLALCLAPRGLAWLAYITGHLKHARPLIIQVITLLYSTGDWVNKAYAELLWGMVKRALAGSDVPKLEAAKKILEGAYNELQDHPLYRARAAHELALACFYLRRDRECEEYLNEVLQIVRSPHTTDVRWQCKALVIWSRLQRRRRDFAAAERTAAHVLSTAQKAHQVLCEIDAFIARGEARLELGKYQKAKEDFRRALRKAKSSDNAQTTAVCNLHLARVYLSENNLRKAEDHFGQWQQLKRLIENQTVHAMANSVQTDIEARKNDFVITSGAANLNFDQHVKTLREFLVKEARRRYSSNDKVAENLGISRQTLYNWENQS